MICVVVGHIKYLKVSGFARYLARVLDGYGKHYLKTDHFVRQLQLSDSGVSGGISPKRSITPRSYLVCN